MIKDVFVLKKNSWHVKLMRWIWDYEYYEFRNMCPYFWLSVLNLIIVIPFAIFMGFKKLFKLLIIPFESYSNYCDRKHIEWIEQMRNKVRSELQSENPDFLYKLSWLERRDFKGASKYRTLWYGLSDETLALIRGRVSKEIEEEQERLIKAEAERKRKRAQAIAKLTMMVKKSIKFVLGAVAIGVTYLLYLFVNWLITLNWAYILKWGLAGLIGIIVIGIGLIILYLIFKGIMMLICKYGKYCIPCEDKRAKIGKTMKLTVSPFVWIWNGIVMIWEIFKALKKDNCPGIDWE